MSNHVATLVSLVAILVSGAAVGLLVTQRKSLGCYTHQLENSHLLTRQSNERVRQEIDRAREYNVTVMLELSKMERRLGLQNPNPDANNEQRSA